MRRLGRRSRPLDHERWVAELETAARVLGVARLPEICLSLDVRGPVVAGLLPPRVVLPWSLPEQSAPRQFVAILVHECAHVGRGDHWVRLLQHFHRTNRRQNVMEFTAADPATGKCRVIVREEWPASWVENLPRMQHLKDKARFVWPSRRTGWRNYYLYDLSGKLLATLTNHECEVDRIVRVDEDAGLLWYMARTGDNPMKLQLHRVGLDGQGDKRLTDPAFHHTCDVSPDGKHIVDVAQTHDKAPVTRLLDAEGKNARPSACCCCSPCRDPFCPRLARQAWALVNERPTDQQFARSIPCYCPLDVVKFTFALRRVAYQREAVWGRKQGLSRPGSSSR